MYGVIGDGIKTWTYLSRIRLPLTEAKTGHRIPLNQGILNVPVLEGKDRHTLTKSAVQMVDSNPQTTQLGQSCGIETRFMGYCLLCGAAYVMATNAWK